MTKQTLEVPKKPTDMAAFWPAGGKKELNRPDGLWLRYRDIQIGPFPNRTEASWYDGQVQEIAMGWIDKSYFAGRIFPHDEQWYVERWETNDGPFTSLAVAWEHRQALYIEYREAIERRWDESGGNPADIERQKKWSKVPAEATDDINFNVSKILAEPRMAIPESLRPKYGKLSQSGRVQVTPEGKVKIMAESGDKDKKATDDPTSNYKGYAFSATKGVIHVDPVTGKLHQDDHICNQQCRDLKARAQAEYLADVDKSGGYLDKPKKATDDIVDVSGESSIRAFVDEHKGLVASGIWIGPSSETLAEWERNKQALEDTSLEDDEDIIPDDKPLTHGDIPVIMGILMDRLNITRFEFSYEEMLAFKGRVILDQPDSRKSSYMMVRQGEK